MQANTEFDNQLATLLDKGYPDLLNISQQAFIDLVSPLRNNLQSQKPFDLESGHLPFVISIKLPPILQEKAFSLIKLNNKHGVTKLFPLLTDDFNDIPSLQSRNHIANLLFDIDRGDALRNITPKDALEVIKNNNRRPLTINEGIAVLTQYPDFLIKNHCFSLLASRTTTDKRVPAIWINQAKHPNLGWCWEGNPHTWLGSISCLP